MSNVATTHVHHPYETLMKLRDLMRASNKIEAIKSLRALSGAGLRESKDFFEDIWEPFIQGKAGTQASMAEDTVLLTESHFGEFERRIKNLEHAVKALQNEGTEDIKEIASDLFVNLDVGHE